MIHKVKQMHTIRKYFDEKDMNCQTEFNIETELINQKWVNLRKRSICDICNTLETHS